MAKELPYFKFEPAEYITKDISFCSYAAQGLFINLCSHYWQRNCEMTLQQAKRRFKDDDLIDELIDEEIIHLDGENIIIRFLISQRDEAIMKSTVNKANGSKGGRPKKPKENPKETEKKPNGLNSITETKGIRRDEIIKDNIKENKDKQEIELTPYELIKSETPARLETWLMKNKSKINNFNDLVDGFNNKALIEIMSDNNPLKFESKMLILRLDNFTRSWINNQKPEDKDKPKEIPNPNNEKIIVFNTNVNPTRQQLPESDFIKYRDNMQQGGYKFNILN